MYITCSNWYYPSAAIDVHFFKITVNSQSHGHGHMPLKTETTYEYYFNNASLYYCKTHDCFRVTDNHEDSVLLNGVEQDEVNDFIANYFEYALEDEDLKDHFRRALRLKELDAKQKEYEANRKEEDE